MCSLWALPKNLWCFNSICAYPSNVAFCSWQMEKLSMHRFSEGCPSKAPSMLITIRTDLYHNLSVPIFRSWYFVSFSSSLSSILLSPGLSPQLPTLSSFQPQLCDGVINQEFISLCSEIPQYFNMLNFYFSILFSIIVI